MRQARFWFIVRGQRHAVDVTVEPDDTAYGVASWVMVLLDRRVPLYRDAPARLITGRYLPEAA